MTSSRTATLGIRPAADLAPEPLGAVAYIVLAVALLGSALAVSSRLGFGNEAYTVPKALALGVAAAASACLLASVRRLRLAWFDAFFAAYLVHGLVAAVTLAPTWAIASASLVPEWSAALLLAFTATAVGGDPRRRDRVLDLVILSATLVACIALLEALGVKLPWDGARRPHSTLGNRNFVGAEAAIAATLAFYRTCARPGVLRAAGVGVLCAIVAISRCRSAWIGLFVSALVGAALYVHWRKGQKRHAPSNRRGVVHALVGASLGLALAVALPWPGLRWTDATSPLQHTLARVADPHTGTGRERLADLEVAATLMRDHPLLGVGPRGWDNAASGAAHAIAGRHATPQHFWTTPNSDLARTAAERGVLGLVLLVSAFAALVVGAFRGTHGAGRGRRLAIVAAFSVLAVNAALDAPFFRASSLATIAVLAGLARVPSRRQVALPRLPLRFGSAALAAVILLAVGLRTAAAALIAASPDGVSAMERAQALFPRPDVAEVLALRNARLGDCDAAAKAGATALAWAPRHWGVPHAIAGCYRAHGDAEAARAYREMRDRIEPHVEALIEGRADIPSGYERNESGAVASARSVGSPL